MEGLSIPSPPFRDVRLVDKNLNHVWYRFLLQLLRRRPCWDAFGPRQHGAPSPTNATRNLAPSSATLALLDQARREHDSLVT